MNRKEIYSKLISLNLQEEAKKRYGRNYTQCSNEQLINLIRVKIQKPKSKDYEKSSVIITDDSFIKLVNILAKKRILLESEVKDIFNN